MFAAQAAIAVNNSRLFAEAQRALKKSDALLEVTNAISQVCLVTFFSVLKDSPHN